VQDGQPGVGERVVVLGQGIVGLLLSGVLAQFPLGSLIALDTLTQRRQLALQFGASDASNPADESEVQFLREKLSASNGKDGADLIYEVSGVPDALNLAVKLSGYASRIVIGSWYGNKSAPIALGGDAHRNRLQFITSQVSTMAPSLSGRWDKQRRFGVAWDMIRKLHPEQLITHRASLQDAAGLYKKLHDGASGIVQALFHHSN
jgi:threonine dehydrogenase-like Zn-dependent dehydrogenase